MEYIFVLVWIGFMALVARSAQFKRTVLVNGVEQQRFNWLFSFAVILPVILLVAYRPLSIGDTYNYMMTYQNAPDSFDELFSYTANLSKDKAYYFCAALFKCITHLDYRAYFIALAALQGISVASLFRKYSDYYCLSVFFFVASADFTWMLNGIRQFTAVTIIIMATSLALQKKYVPLLIVVVLASLFHQSALMMIPVFLIAIGTPWNKRTTILIIGMLVAVIFIDVFTSWLGDSLQDTQYSNAMDFIISDEDDGTNPLRAAFFSLPAIISFFGRKKIKEFDSPVVSMCTNMSIITAVLYLISTFTSGITLGRLPIYTALYSYILLPWELEHIVSPKYRSPIKIGVVLLFLFFYYYQMHIAWHMF